MSQAFVICNGPSRSDFDLELLRGQDNIFGCNIAVLEFDGITSSVIIDEPVYRELLDNGVSKESIIVAEGEEQFEPANKPGPRAKNNAGVFAIKQAVKTGAEVIYILGMDCILAEGDFLGNVYLGKKNFPSKVSFEDQRRRLFYLDWFCQQHPKVKFVFCFPDNAKSFNRVEAGNVVGMKFSSFKERLNA